MNEKLSALMYVLSGFAGDEGVWTSRHGDNFTAQDKCEKYEAALRF